MPRPNSGSITMALWRWRRRISNGLEESAISPFVMQEDRVELDMGKLHCPQPFDRGLCVARKEELRRLPVRHGVGGSLGHDEIVSREGAREGQGRDRNGVVGHGIGGE